MSEDDIRTAIIEGLRRIAPESDPAALIPGANLREALDIDSFDFLNFLIALHERLGIEIPEADYGRLDTLDHIVAYLAAKAT